MNCLVGGFQKRCHKEGRKEGKKRDLGCLDAAANQWEPLKDGQMDGGIVGGRAKWEGVWKRLLPHLPVINMEEEQLGSASPPTSRMLACFSRRGGGDAADE